MVRKVYYFFKNNFYYIKLWVFFLFYFCNIYKGKFWIFHNQPWHFGWDLESRYSAYKNKFNPSHIFIIDFDNRLMVFMLYLALRFKGLPKFNINKSAIEVAARSSWDKKIREKNFCSSVKKLSSGNYDLIIDNFLSKIRRDGHYNRIFNIFSSEIIKGVCVVQNGYTDNFLQYCANVNSKGIINFETKKGAFLYSSRFFEHYAGLYSDAKFDFNIWRKQAVDSLSGRVEGNYTQSNFDKVFKENIYNSGNLTIDEPQRDSLVIVLFLHQFTDAPNSGVFTGNDFHYWDHYCFIRDLLDTLSEFKDSIELYIKPHPPVRSYPGDEIFMLAIEEQICGMENVHLLENYISISEISRIFPNMIGLTGGGSVTLELAFLGVPVLNYQESIYTLTGLANRVKSSKEIPNLLFNSDFSVADLDDVLNFEAFEFYMADLARIDWFHSLKTAGVFKN